MIYYIFKTDMGFRFYRESNERLQFLTKDNFWKTTGKYQNSIIDVALACGDTLECTAYSESEFNRVRMGLEMLK